MAGMAIAAIATVGTSRGKGMPFTPTDGLAVLFAVLTLCTYDRQLNPEPEKLLFGGQLLILWFLLRYFLTGTRGLAFFFLSVLMVTGMAEAVWGIRQLHGGTWSNHAFFRLTGSFFNPGPYSGYIAMVLPLCLWTALRFEKMAQYAGWAGVGLILVVLPAGMSRSAWMTAAVACGWVYWTERIGWERTKAFYNRYWKATIPLVAASLLLLACAAAGLYGMKRDSADGRLLMWKVTARAIAEHPLKGTGIGGFPAAYAEAQAEYFDEGKASGQEQRVAGCPEYAFNEYLQIGLEQGLGGLAVFLLWVGCLVRDGIRHRQEGAAGGVIALAVFALSSYPLQLPSFWVALVFLGAICATGGDASSRRKGHLLAVVLLSAASLVLFARQGKQYDAYRQWSRIQTLYNSKAYGSVVEEYVALHDRLGHKPEFLFEEAQCLGKTGQYEEAIHVLERAERLSGDPMIRYIAARNRQSLGDCRGAEEELLRAIRILPERIYPYYLLAKLYADPACPEPKKFRKAARIVLTKEPKVESTAIREMREEIERISKKKDYETSVN